MTEGSELWTVDGPYFRLPISVLWHDTLAEVSLGAGVSLLKKQEAALREIVGKDSRERDGRFFLYAPDLKRVAVRSSLTDPEDVVEWLPDRGTAKIPGEPDDKRSPDEFILAYCRSSYAISDDPQMMDIIWISFCKFALDWLLNKERELDMHFVRLVPLLLRQNWSNSLAKYEHDKRKKRAEDNPKQKEQDWFGTDPQGMVSRGLADYLVGPKVLSLDVGKNVLRYTLEAIPTDFFRNTALRLELGKRRVKCGKYWHSAANQLKRQLPAALEIYAYHLVESAYPGAAVFEREPGRSAPPRKRKAGFGEAAKTAGHWGVNSAVCVAPQEEGGAGADNRAADLVQDKVPDL